MDYKPFYRLLARRFWETITPEEQLQMDQWLARDAELRKFVDENLSDRQIAEGMEAELDYYDLKLREEFEADYPGINYDDFIAGRVDIPE